MNTYVEECLARGNAPVKEDFLILEPRQKRARMGMNTTAERRQNSRSSKSFGGKTKPENEMNFFDLNQQTSLKKKTYEFSRTKKVLETLREEAERKIDETRERKLNFRDKLILAPLTTVGNLPFRRVCIKQGADVTVSEMALSTSILQGQQGELALLRRHEDEKFFGVQIAGGSLPALLQAGEFLDNHVSCDFIDLNFACPLDDLTNKGVGAGALRRANFCRQAILGLQQVTSKPITCKIRVAMKQKGKNRGDAESVLKKIADTNLEACFCHGRTAQQRYTKRPDWERVRNLRKISEIPIIGCGDIFSFQDFDEHRKNEDSEAYMIGRGALIKPWIFREIREQRLIDISSSERFDILKEFCNFGLQHWGSDEKGVATTRRFLLEELSFFHRYIPVGLLEYLPQKLNWRPPAYFGRNELETLFISDRVEDWIDISEKLLGKVPDDFRFIPKHKSNSYENTEN